MLRCMAVLCITLCLQILAGCSTGNLSRGFYDGIKVQSDLQSSPDERFGKPEAPDYQEYERMKKEKR